MRYLNTALVSEGRTDDRLLPRLLGRALDDLCAHDFQDTVDIPDITVLRDRSGPPPVDAIMNVVERNTGSFYLCSSIAIRVPTAPNSTPNGPRRYGPGGKGGSRSW